MIEKCTTHFSWVLSFSKISRASSKSFSPSLVFSVFLLRFRLSIFLSSSAFTFLHFSSSSSRPPLLCYRSLYVELSSSLRFYVAASSSNLLSHFFRLVSRAYIFTLKENAICKTVILYLVTFVSTLSNELVIPFPIEATQMMKDPGYLNFASSTIGSDSFSLVYPFLHFIPFCRSYFFVISLFYVLLYLSFDKKKGNICPLILFDLLSSLRCRNIIYSSYILTIISTEWSLSEKARIIKKDL